MSTGVMHIVDTLEIGGLERIAVSLANQVSTAGYRSFLCATRSAGPLLSAVSADVETLVLQRKHRFDMGPIAQLRLFLKQRKIAILHAHGSALFAARVAAIGMPETGVIWHAHYGRFANQDRASISWRAATRGISAVIPVSKQLAHWVEKVLGVPSSRIHYVPNFVASHPGRQPVSLPGTPGYRCVCVANARPEKGLDILLEAFRLLRSRVPQAHLLIVGRTDAGNSFHAALLDPLLKDHVTLLGERNDVPSILASCDVGVLSSRVEGLPISLLEYGAAGLGSVCTRVGQCEEVADGGRAALVVSPSNPNELAQGIGALLQSPEHRSSLGVAFQRRVLDSYSAEAAWKSVQPIYDEIVSRRAVA